jgi:hypothetical protein
MNTNPDPRFDRDPVDPHRDIDNRDIDIASERNPDPITGEPGSRPVATGIGAVGAGAIGTAAGVAVGGPIGGAVGAVVGSVVGGLVGKGVSETVDPTVEDTYWRHHYLDRPYVDPAYSYDDYGYAYRTGYEGYSTYYPQGMSYQQAEPYLRQRYERDRRSSPLRWDKARYASQDAWERLEYRTAQERRDDRV